MQKFALLSTPSLAVYAVGLGDTGKDSNGTDLGCSQTGQASMFLFVKFPR